MKILSIAIIGRHNQPLFVRAYDNNAGSPSDGDDHELRWHFIAHTSLDVFEERESIATRQSDHYVGLLQVMDDYAVYGYQTSTRVRLVLVLGLTEETVRDNDIKTIFRAIHNAYVGYLSNPFTEAVAEQTEHTAPPIRSRKFEKRLEAIAQAQNGPE